MLFKNVLLHIKKQMSKQVRQIQQKNNFIYDNANSQDDAFNKKLISVKISNYEQRKTLKGYHII